MPDNGARNAMPRNSIGGNIGPGGRLGNAAPIKPDNLWGVNPNMGGGGGGGNRNGVWDDTSSNASNWDDKSGSLWNDNGWNKNKPNQMWPSDPVDNSAGDNFMGSQMPKMFSNMNQMEFIRNSKQFRMLMEKGFKKEDIELALRTTNMNLEESFEMLRSNSSSIMGGGGAGAGGNGWRDDHNNGFDQFGRFSGNMPFQQVRESM
jgi:trinucleotide repeat-containing gene 6 protein